MGHGPNVLPNFRTTADRDGRTGFFSSDVLHTVVRFWTLLIVLATVIRLSVEDFGKGKRVSLARAAVGLLSGGHTSLLLLANLYEPGPETWLVCRGTAKIFSKVVCFSI